MKEGSLVAFTLLAQLAAGALWAWSAWAIAGQAPSDAWSTLVLAGIAALMVLAMAASLFHLGTPKKAWRAWLGWRRSWVSREILSAGALTVATAVAAAAPMLGTGAELRAAAAAGGDLLAVLLVVSMTRAYRLRTIPSWNTWVTPVSFFATAVSLGALAVGVALSFEQAGAGVFGGTAAASPATSVAVQRWAALVAAVSLVLDVAVTPLRPGARDSGALSWTRALLAFGAAGSAVCVASRVFPPAALFVALGLAALSAAIGRFGFYAARTGAGV